LYDKIALNNTWIYFPISTIHHIEINERGGLRVKQVTIALLSVLLLTSCSILHNDTDGEKFQFEGKQILFFTDERYINDEAVYYDALLDLKHEYPDEIENMMVFHAKQTDNEPFNINTYPSLVVVENNEIIMHIKGHVEQKEEIVNSIAKVLSE